MCEERGRSPETKSHLAGCPPTTGIPSPKEAVEVSPPPGPMMGHSGGWTYICLHPLSLVLCCSPAVNSRATNSGKQRNKRSELGEEAGCPFSPHFPVLSQQKVTTGLKEDEFQSSC